jgi:hypothetical protein
LEAVTKRKIKSHIVFQSVNRKILRLTQIKSEFRNSLVWANVGAHAACLATLIFISTQIDCCGANRLPRRPHFYRKRKGGQPPAFFSRLNLKHASKGLEAYGFRVAKTRIKVSDALKTLRSTGRANVIPSSSGS